MGIPVRRMFGDEALLVMMGCGETASVFGAASLNSVQGQGACADGAACEAVARRAQQGG